MGERVTLQARWPLAELEQKLRERLAISQDLADVRVEGSDLVFEFWVAPTPRPRSGRTPQKAKKQVQKQKDSPVGARKRRKSNRNRMRTRGWELVGKITNSNGQTAVIYKPLVDALSIPGLSPEQQRDAVERVLKSNGNKPKDASIDYYLNNTLEYLARSH